MISPFFWWFALAAAVVALGAGRAGKSLRPRISSLEHASSESHAKNVLGDWQQGKQVGLAIAAVILDAILVLLLVITAEILLFWMYNRSAGAIIDRNSVEGIAATMVGFIHVLIMVLVGIAGLANLAADLAMLIMIAKAKPYEPLVLIARVVGWFKYGMMAITLLYLLLRAELSIDERMRKIVQPHHWKTIGWMTLAMLLLALWVARRLSIFSQQHPTVLSLQLAPDRLTAQGILDRWGRSGRKNAAVTLLAQTAFALLYGVTLATLCREVVVNAPKLQKAANVAALFVIVAAACHVGQNLGTLLAVQRAQMGWWITAIRRVGKLRMCLIGLVAFYFVALVIRLEWHGLMAVADWIDGARRKMTLPWSGN